MNKSDITKKAKAKYIFFNFISICLTVMPLIVYVMIGLFNGDIHKGEKVFLGFTVIMAIMLTSLNIIKKHKLRSPLFILILGIYYAIDNILPLFILISSGIILDEFIFTPLTRKYKNKYTINKEIDRR